MNRQFDVPTFSQISSDLKVYHTLLYQFTRSFLDTSSKEPYLELLAVNHDIKNTIQTLTHFEDELRKRVQFYDAQPEPETILVRTLESMMKLPPSCQPLIAKKEKRKSSYTPRQKVRGPYRSYSIEEKNHVVQLNLSGMTFATISKNLEIPQKNVVRWCKEGLIGKETSRRIADAAMEEALAEWIEKAKHTTVLKQAEIQQKARELSTNPHFKASRGWLKNFLKRNCKDIKEEHIE